MRSLVRIACAIYLNKREESNVQDLASIYTPDRKKGLVGKILFSKVLQLVLSISVPLPARKNALKFTLLMFILPLYISLPDLYFDLLPQYHTLINTFLKIMLSQESQLCVVVKLPD